MIFLLLNLALASTSPAWAAPSPPPTALNRVASVYLSEDFINEQMALHVKSEVIEKMSVKLDPEHDQILLLGILNVPVEELRAINLDPKLGKFRFQMALKISTTKQGHLIIEFPLNETFFYPADSQDPQQDRVIVPVQMLSLALTSARGYLAAVSGDFGGFDRRTRTLQAQLRALDHSIATEKNAEVLDDLKTQRESLKLQLEAMPIERKQLQGVAKEFSSMLSFTGEKELSLNDEFAAKKNALILKLKISQFLPYLKGVELGGVRLRHDKKDGNGQNYFVIDIDSQLDVAQTAAPAAAKPSDRPPMKVAPSLIMRLNQSLFESESLVAEEKKKMGSKLKDFEMQLKDDGIHVSGKWHAFLVFSIPFETVVDLVSVAPDVFEVRMREMEVAGIDLEFLSKFVLDSMRKRLDESMKGICKFQDVQGSGGHVRALRVTVDPKALVPAAPDLHLVSVDIRDGEFLMKVGRI